MSQLTRAQVETLLRPIKPKRVLKAQGQSHVAAFDVTAHLTRMFGFGGWEKQLLSLDLVHERHTDPDPDRKNDQGRWWVTYRCVMRLTIRDPHGRLLCQIEDAATGSAQNMPTPADAHDFAVKNAVSYALKRCAKDLGDQFGLSLYNGGQVTALVGATLVMPPPDAVEQDTPDVESHAPVPVGMGNDERSEPEPESGGVVEPEVSPASVPTPPSDERAPLGDEHRVTVDQLRKRMTPAQKGAVRAFMATHGIPSLAAASVDQLSMLAVECERVLAEEGVAS